MQVTIKKLTNYNLMKLAMEYTSDKSVTLNEQNISWMYNAEHSPIRTQIYSIELRGIPTYVSVHLTRHKIGVEHFVKSNRDKDETITRETLVNHLMIINANALINMARKRLCNKADIQTVHVMECIKNELIKEDSSLARHLVPECEYRGRCPELYPCKKRKELSW